ncbi:uncharacterized protein LOC133734509 isoform X2 [Rosa rugosa]|uniref:uncharacterized protein LOC133723484 isoform X2 n=1 Tax=Rosa rugosa TaxID=74645 RepID=UPI002B40772C|nr:uncharacterized protein LOC133723484 isoform X2 [Rosa rugosa]XP_062018124.1 uncharacterized protein LOC133734509 isoform X2 [Rosa rugosa]
MAELEVPRGNNSIPLGKRRRLFDPSRRLPGLHDHPGARVRDPLLRLEQVRRCIIATASVVKSIKDIKGAAFFAAHELQELLGSCLVMVSQEASQARFRVLKHENGIDGSATIISTSSGLPGPIPDVADAVVQVEIN